MTVGNMVHVTILEFRCFLKITSVTGKKSKFG
jgi:hypothetical protein